MEYAKSVLDCPLCRKQTALIDNNMPSVNYSLIELIDEANTLNTFTPDEGFPLARRFCHFTGIDKINYNGTFRDTVLCAIISPLVTIDVLGNHVKRLFL
jgi:hypothetical protein